MKAVGTRRSVWVALAFALACSDGAEPGAPGILLVTLDTVRADALGAYGSTNGASPHLDALAAQGVLFEQAHASSPNTLPSHASIMSGLQPYRHHVRENGVGKLGDELVTLAERLRAAGYTTGAEVADVVLARTTRIDQGFEHFRDTTAAGVDLQTLRVSPDGTLSDPSVAAAGDGAKLVDLHTRSGSDITRSGVEFLREHGDKPFFLWLHYWDAHWPYAPPTPYASQFGGDRYAGEVAYVDASFAGVLGELEKLGLDDRTLVVVTGDHGEGLGEHGESRHSYLVYQSTMHVPLIFTGPRVARGRRVTTPVETVDIAPTILAWAGLEPNTAESGRSLLPAFEGGPLPDRLVYGESISLRRLVDTSPLRFVREGRWKLIHKPNPELYDLNSDPDETKDLFRAEAARAEQLRTQLGTLIAGPSDPPGGSQNQLDQKTRQQLESLGYVVGGSTRDDDASLDTIEVHGADPTQAVAKIEPAIAAMATAQFADRRETVPILEGLAREFPESSGILEMLLDAQLAIGQSEAAIASLRRGVEIDPEHQRYWSNLGELLAHLGRDAEAKKALNETLRRWPCDLSSRTNLANVLGRAGARAEQIETLERGVAECGSPPELMNDLAYQLATVPAANLRNGARALELAEKMIQSFGDNPLALDTLAVTQAEVGRQGDARATLARALALAERQRLPEAALVVLRDHAAKVEAGQPIRE